MDNDIQQKLKEIDKQFINVRKKLIFKIIFLFSPIISVLFALGFSFLWNKFASHIYGSVTLPIAILSGASCCLLIAILLPFSIMLQYKLPSVISIKRITKMLMPYGAGEIKDASKDFSIMMTFYRQAKFLRQDKSKNKA